MQSQPESVDEEESEVQYIPETDTLNDQKAEEVPSTPRQLVFSEKRSTSRRGPTGESRSDKAKARTWAI